ncbi:IclR family transcriptional regulator [Devosia crocina]|uniref:IclR family transcriptional regulator n=1 Tax=Devosia crocina TaxID=429728 RepID=UPI001FCD6B14|nr:IclR family transcriptional regulator [Devosia crocina]
MPEISQTADQMLIVLENIADAGPASAAEVARNCDLNRTVALRLLNTLAQRNYIRRTTEGYVLGTAAIRLGHSAEEDISVLAKPMMDRLADQVSETVVLHCMEKDEAVVVEQAIGAKHLVRVQHQPGSRHPLFIGASGWSILAFQDEKTISRVLKKSLDANEARSRIAKIRVDGFAISHDELQQGVHGIAAPLKEADGSCSASIAILVPSLRADGVTKLARPLLKLAGDISDALQRR